METEKKLSAKELKKLEKQARRKQIVAQKGDAAEKKEEGIKVDQFPENHSAIFLTDDITSGKHFFLESTIGQTE